MVKEDNMTALLAADVVAIRKHPFQNVSVPDRGLQNMDILFLAHHRQPKVGHHRSDNRILRQCASFLHIQTANGKNLIPVD